MDAYRLDVGEDFFISNEGDTITECSVILASLTASFLIVVATPVPFFMFPLIIKSGQHCNTAVEDVLHSVEVICG